MVVVPQIVMPVDPALDCSVGRIDSFSYLLQFGLPQRNDIHSSSQVILAHFCFPRNVSTNIVYSQIMKQDLAYHKNLEDISWS